MVCNDDGFDSPGIRILVDAVRKFTDDVWTVSPSTNQSARSRAYSIARDIRVRQFSERTFAVDGTPVDCAIIGLNGLIPGKRPDLVLSGVNEGTNLAEDIPASGTIGACLEAADQGVPAIAFSQVGTYKETEGGDWLAAKTILPELLPKLVSNLGATLPVLNVNFPQLETIEQFKGVKVTASGRRPISVQVDKKDNPNPSEYTFYFDLLRDDRATHSDSDIHYAFEKFVTVTPLVQSLTDYAGLSVINLEPLTVNFDKQTARKT